jgi:hypothetical protein
MSYPVQSNMEHFIKVCYIDLVCILINVLHLIKHKWDNLSYHIKLTTINTKITAEHLVPSLSFSNS